MLEIIRYRDPSGKFVIAATLTVSATSVLVNALVDLAVTAVVVKVGYDIITETNNRIDAMNTIKPGEKRNNGKTGQKFKGKNQARSIENELGEIASGYGNLKCKEAAAAMEAYLKKNKQKYELIKITFKGGPGYVYSNMYDRQISENGVHVGIVYNEIAYCNVHPYGLPVRTWVNDFEAVGLRTVTPLKYNY